MHEQYSHLKSIFGGKLAPHTSGFRSAIGMEAEKQEKKPDDRSVPTHWQAELHDRAAVSVLKLFAEIVDFISLFI